MEAIASPTTELQAQNEDPVDSFANRKKIYNRDKIAQMKIDSWGIENPGEIAVKHQSQHFRKLIIKKEDYQKKWQMRMNGFLEPKQMTKALWLANALGQNEDEIDEPQ